MAKKDLNRLFTLKNKINLEIIRNNNRNNRNIDCKL